MKSKIDERLKAKNVDLNRLFRIYLWVIIGISITIFCILCVIGGLVLYLLLTNQIHNIPFDYEVVIATFVVADIVCLIVWFVMVHLCMLRAYKMKVELQTKKFNILNLVFLIIMFLANIAVIVLVVLLFGGFITDIDTRTTLAYAIASLEFFKGLIMVGILATTGRLLTRLRKNKKVQQ